MRSILCVMSLLCSFALHAQELPKTVDLRVDNGPLLTLVERIANQANMGLIADDGLQGRLAQNISMYVQDAPWKDVEKLLLDEYGLNIIVEGDLFRLRDADLAYRERCELRTYEVRHLVVGTAQFPGPESSSPEPGGTGSMSIPEIEDDDPVSIDEIRELLLTIVEPESWDRDGVSIDELDGQLAVIHVPEVHEQLATMLERIEQLASRRVEAVIYRVEANKAPEKVILDAEEWAEFTAKPLSIHGNIVLRDGQRNHHSSGVLRELLADQEISGGTFDPIISVVRNGVVVDIEPQITVAGILTTARISKGFTKDHDQNTIKLGETELAAIELPRRDYNESNDTRLIPFGGAACYRMGAEVIIVHVSVHK